MLKIDEENFLKVNGQSVDCNITLSDCSIHLLSGANGIGKTSFLEQLVDLDFSMTTCLQERLKSINSLRLQDILAMFHPFDFTSLVEDFGLSAHLGKEINDLSGGENQALKIILALAQDSELYIFDEPSQYLDTIKLNMLKTKLVELKKKKIVLLVEHNGEYLSDLSINHISMNEVDKRIRLENA